MFRKLWIWDGPIKNSSGFRSGDLTVQDHFIESNGWKHSNWTGYRLLQWNINTNASRTIPSLCDKTAVAHKSPFTRPDYATATTNLSSTLNGRQISPVPVTSHNFPWDNVIYSPLFGLHNKIMMTRNLNVNWIINQGQYLPWIISVCHTQRHLVRDQHRAHCASVNIGRRDPMYRTGCPNLTAIFHRNKNSLRSGTTAINFRLVKQKRNSY